MAKTYPFSVAKHAHDIEYRYNFVYNRVYDSEGEHGWTAEQVARGEEELDRLNDLRQSLLFNGDGRVAWLTGKEYGLAKECVIWATERRAYHAEQRRRK